MAESTPAQDASRSSSGTAGTEVLDPKLFHEYVQSLCTLMLDAKPDELSSVFGSSASQEHLTKFVSEGHEPVLFLQRIIQENAETTMCTIFSAIRLDHILQPRARQFCCLARYSIPFSMAATFFPLRSMSLSNSWGSCGKIKINTGNLNIFTISSDFFSFTR
jgi:hypothetical protein